MAELIFLQELIEIYSWVAAGILMLFVTAIANFYQKKFGVKTFYHFYFIPIIVLFSAGFHIFAYHTFFSEIVEFAGSFLSFLASFLLYRTMVGVK